MSSQLAFSTHDTSTTTLAVRRQYEAFPYSARDPADERRSLKVTPCDDLQILNHYCFRGRRDFRKPVRVLVAGGGTGDATIFLAEQLRGTDSTIVHLDLSDAAIDVARGRARQRGTESSIQWLRGSLLDLPDSDLGPFDYINCNGVLHHLADPTAGLQAVRSVLCDDGAIGLMAYGQYGRTGIYQMQDLMRLINHDESEARGKIENTTATIAALPESNWLKRGGFNASSIDVNVDGVGDDGGSAKCVDMFLHAQDRAYTVPQLYDWLAAADLHLVEFVGRFRQLYDPAVAIKDVRLLEKIAGLPKPQQQAVGELLWGAIDRHIFWAAPREDTIADRNDPDNVPGFTLGAELIDLKRSVLQHEDGPFLVESVAGGVRRRFTIELDSVRRSLLGHIDRRRTLEEIAMATSAALGGVESIDRIWLTLQETLEPLVQADLVALEHVSLQGRRP